MRKTAAFYNQGSGTYIKQNIYNNQLNSSEARRPRHILVCLRVRNLFHVSQNRKKTFLHETNACDFFGVGKL
jgi:hypothetical protein